MWHRCNLTRSPEFNAARFAQFSDDGLRRILSEWFRWPPYDLGLRAEIEKELERRAGK